DCAGTDGSETYEYAGHSANNMKTMHRFLVGSLAGYMVADPAEDVFPGAPHGSSAAKKMNGSSSPLGLLSLKTWRTRPLLLLLAAMSVLLFAGLSYWNFGAQVAITDGGFETGQSRDIGHELARHAPTYAFLGGLLVASSLSCAGFAVLYSLFGKTLEHERDVFSYPAVIPRRVRT
ncbi:MAG: hypothetical protein Q9184_005489, partial [Pyrenodesmia sp. 2 TL-2023]